MIQKLIYIILLQVILLLSSCNKPECFTKNIIFKNNVPNSKIYKGELVKKLKTVEQEDLRFWLKSYDEETLYFNIQGNNLCAILPLTIKDWKKLESVQKSNVKGYVGAEFTNLNFDIIQDSIATKFIYKNYDYIID
jgi:hypothetical protein